MMRLGAELPGFRPLVVGMVIHGDNLGNWPSPALRSAFGALHLQPMSTTSLLRATEAQTP